MHLGNLSLCPCTLLHSRDKITPNYVLRNCFKGVLSIPFTARKETALGFYTHVPGQKEFQRVQRNGNLGSTNFKVLRFYRKEV